LLGGVPIELPVHRLPFQLSVLVGAGQLSSSTPPSQAGELAGALQNRSSPSCLRMKQYPRATDAPSEPGGGAQSSSLRQGAQKVPSPTQTPARGMQTLVPLTQSAPPEQSAELAHSGVQVPPTQCWNVPLAWGHPSSLVHWPASPVTAHTFQGGAHTASTGQFELAEQCFAQNDVPSRPGTQLTGVPPLKQSKSFLQGEHERLGNAGSPAAVRGRQTVRVRPYVGLSEVALGP
jgi:hypothetical protein